MQNQKDTESWIKEFDERFGDEYNHVPGNRKIIRTGVLLEDLYYFIDSVLDSALQEQRKEIVERIKALNYAVGDEIIALINKE
jgi:hypothetical protein